ncbi:MAG: hypothetical protein R3D33_10515 [Hyphomicrobiaceae bacterium]
MYGISFQQYALVLQRVLVEEEHEASAPDGFTDLSAAIDDSTFLLRAAPESIPSDIDHLLPDADDYSSMIRDLQSIADLISDERQRSR